MRWADPQLAAGCSAVRAQLQAGRADDLLGAGFAARSGSRTRYVLFHPGSTRSGDRSGLPVVVRGLLAVASLAARSVADAVAPIHGFVDGPPAAAALTAVDRGRVLPPDFPTLDAGAAARLMGLTERLLAGREGQAA